MNQTIMISDADSDLGIRLAHRFCEEGASLLLVSESGGQHLAELQAHLKNKGTAYYIGQADLCKGSEVQRLLAEAEPVVGPVDVLVHNNNLIADSEIASCSETDFYRYMNANAKTAFILTRDVGAHMAARGRGRIVYISSVHADKPTGSAPLYSMGKGAVQMLCREAALELGRKGVNVNVIEVGPLEETQQAFTSRHSHLFENLQRKIPNAEFGTYQDVEETLLFLISDRAGYINGVNLRLDGGFVLHYMDHKMKPLAGQ